MANQIRFFMVLCFFLLAVLVIFTTSVPNAEAKGNPNKPPPPQIDSITPFFNQLDACDIGGAPTTCDVLEITGSDLRSCDGGSGVCEFPDVSIIIEGVESNFDPVASDPSSTETVRVGMVNLPAGTYVLNYEVEASTDSIDLTTGPVGAEGPKGDTGAAGADGVNGILQGKGATAVEADALDGTIYSVSGERPFTQDDSLVFLKMSCFDQTDIAISGICNTNMSEGTHLIIAGTTGNARNWEKAGYACEYGNRERVSGKIIVQVDCIKIPPRGDD